MEIGLVFEPPLTSAEWGHAPSSSPYTAVVHNGCHSLFGCHFGVGSNPPGMAHIVHGHEAYAVFASLVHGEPRGEARDDLAESAVAVDLAHCHMLPDHLRLSQRVKSPFPDVPDILGDAYEAMGVMPSQVGVG